MKMEQPLDNFLYNSECSPNEKKTFFKNVFLVCKTNIDSSFPNQLFSFSEHRMYQKDRNTHEGGLLFYVNQDLN